MRLRRFNEDFTKGGKGTFRDNLKSFMKIDDLLEIFNNYFLDISYLDILVLETVGGWNMDSATIKDDFPNVRFTIDARDVIFPNPSDFSFVVKFVVEFVWEGDDLTEFYDRLDQLLIDVGMDRGDTRDKYGNFDKINSTNINNLKIKPGTRFIDFVMPLSHKDVRSLIYSSYETS